MGTAVSTNVSSQLISASTDIVTNTYQNCQMTSSQVQQIAVQGCSNVTIDNNYFNQFYAVRGDCVQQISTSSATTANLQQQAQQLATALTQQFGLGIADATNVSNNSIQLINDINNSYVQNCATTISSGQQIKCIDSNNVEINGNTFSQTLNDTKTCMQQAVTDNQADLAIKQTISQTAKAKEANFLAGILGGIGILLVLGIIILMVFYGGGGKKK